MTKKGLYIIRAVILLLTVCLISFPASGFADDSKGCSIIGSWYGYYPAPDNTLLWTISVFGKSESSGISNLEAPSYDPTFGGLFPTGVNISTLRGVWQRTSGNTFSTTLIGFSVDDSKQTVGIAKMSGTATLMDDCNMEMLELTLEFFGPTDDPFTDDPFYGLVLPVHFGYRVFVDTPYQE